MDDRKIRILLAEDDKVDQMAFERYVKKNIPSYDYSIAGSIAKTEKIMKSNSFDVVISDYMLGDGTSFELFDLFKDLPVIVTTDTGNEEVAVEAMKLGAYDYLIKDPEGNYLKVLPATVELALKRKQAEIELKNYHDNLKSMVEKRTAQLRAEIFERKKLESQIHQSQKMEAIGTLAGGIAHDFNNILFAIVGQSEILLEEIPKESPFQSGLDQIYTAAMRASELVKQILIFSRQESGDMRLMKVQPIIKESLKLIRSTIPTTIDIQHNIQPDCGVIKADPTQIHQIIMNIATNAYHAMEETGGVLTISLNEIQLSRHDIKTLEISPGSYVCLRVADTGIGMDKNLIDKIFEPFFTTKGKAKGTGMGLSVVHGIVKSMGGSIQVYSKPGQGSEFKAYFPVEKNVPKKHKPKDKGPVRGGTERILLVDDEEAIAALVKQMLERMGYQVTSCNSSIDALETFHTNPDKFDLVITDATMPGMTGNQLSKKITRIRPDIPVLLCTGFSEHMSDENAISMGIKGFLLKPVEINDLALKIHEVLDKN